MIRSSRVPPFIIYIAPPEKEEDPYYQPTINRGAVWVIILLFLALIGVALIGVAVFAWFFPVISASFCAGFLVGRWRRVNPVDLRLPEDLPK